MVLTQGEVIEQRSHLQLIDLGGTYSELVKAQTLQMGNATETQCDIPENEQ